MLIGIVAGLMTGALWGLTFVGPRAVEPFTAWDLTVARYGIFGLACLMSMMHPRFRPSGLRLRQVVTGLLLGGAGYVGYFISAAYAVRLAGATIPPLIIGTMPVLLAIIANLKDKSASWRSIAVPLFLIGSGIAVVNLSVFRAAGHGARGDIVIGMASACLALAIWVVYGLVNAAALKAPDAPDGLHWTGLQGIGAALGSFLLLPLTSFSTENLGPDDGSRFILWALVMGLAGSWGATFCWIVASRRLPLALCAQLIVAETVFGLIFGLAFEDRWPTIPEWIGCALQLAGVMIAISVFSKPRLLDDVPDSAALQPIGTIPASPASGGGQ